MAMTMKKPNPETTATLPDLQRAHDEAVAVVTRLRAIDNPQRFGWSGAGATPLERLQALRDLPAAERRMLETETALLEAKAADAVLQRERRELAFRDAEAHARRALPPIIAKLREAQAMAQALAPAMDAADHDALGGLVRFSYACWPALREGGDLDAWLRQMTQLYQLEPM
jgi:hypothetical protein